MQALRYVIRKSTLKLEFQKRRYGDGTIIMKKYLRLQTVQEIQRQQWLKMQEGGS